MKKVSIELNDIEQVVFVATLPRSGSSMNCGILEACGAFGGTTIGSVPSNPKGIFENRGLNSLILKPLFDEMEIRTPRSLLTLHKSGGPPKELFKDFEQDFVYGMNKQGYKSGVAYYKNGLYTFMFNRINEIFPDAIWILPYRNSDSIIRSTKRINPDKPIDKIKQDIKDYRLMYNHISLVGGDRVFVVDNDEVMAGNYNTIKNAVCRAGLKWDETAVAEWIDGDLWGEEKYADINNPEKTEAKSPQISGNNSYPRA